MTYPVIFDNGYSGFPRHYYKCPICGMRIRHVTKHNNQRHNEVHRY